MVLLIGFSLTVAAGFLAAFIWALRRGQYDDTYTPAVRMLWDNDKSSKKAPTVGSEKNHKQ